MERVEVDRSIIGQAEIWQQMCAFTSSMLLKCAVELRIADIIHSHGSPITLSQIASGITDSSSPNIFYLERIMRFLVFKNIFTANRPSDGGETLYGLTHQSRSILWDSKPSLVPFILFQNYPMMIHSWHYLSQCVKDGGLAFKRANGCEIWEFMSKNQESNNLFNSAMATTVPILVDVFLPAYEDELSKIGSLVDIGGGTGGLMHEIVKSHPQIKGINFDLPHVIATAPVHEGVTHIGGNMFESVPSADAVLLKTVLHDWGDEECVRILKNCRNAIPENTGKVIIVDIVLDEEDDNIFKESQIMIDITLMIFTTGKERTEVQWKKLLEEGGFPRYKIIKLPARECIIEAYPI
ncbi:desmethylxanthohumol 6'-O-methyltransferase-like [Ziziphus jujuba]|uniref:Desmethylxanthohumol 6'-O-methyltransferase-like n=1 Tax=Ziziphus jujuba TaxID=326968 RepID=A0ABM3I6N8_ZIZJJ|nr:desmethylxanthohumol 6'-O-methyltransferase-like [Ziziphus jujuba]